MIACGNHILLLYFCGDDTPPSSLGVLDGHGLGIASDLSMIVDPEVTETGEEDPVIMNIGTIIVLGIGKAPVMGEVYLVRRSYLGVTIFQCFKESLVSLIYPDGNVLPYLRMDEGEVIILMGQITDG